MAQWKANTRSGLSRQRGVQGALANKLAAGSRANALASTLASLGLQVSIHGGRWRGSSIEEEYRPPRAVDGATPPW